MNGVTFAVAAASLAAMACATGASGFDGPLDGGDPVPGDSSVLDGTIEAAVESGAGAVDAAVEDATEDVAVDTDPNDGGDESSVDGGRDRSPDAALDANVADGAAVPPALGSCAPAAWVVTASVSGPNNPPAFAVDGLPPTRWSTGLDQAVGQYFQIDFGGLVTVTQVTLDDSFSSTEEADYPRGIAVLASTDGVNFGTTLATEAYATDPGAIVTIGFAAATARAIRLQLTTGVSSEWWSIHELRLGCQSLQTDGGGVAPSDAGATPLPSCAATVAGDAGWVANTGISPTGWVGSASSTGPNDTIAGAFDESSTTRWSSGQAQAGGEWFQIDLGAATSISGVSLYLLDGNVTDYPSSYALQLSSDNLTFTTVASGLGAPTTAICVPPQSARYVKVTQTGTGDPSWWSIYEINVFP